MQYLLYELSQLVCITLSALCQKVANSSSTFSKPCAHVSVWQRQVTTSLQHQGTVTYLQPFGIKLFVNKILGRTEQ
ncbi:hypothetical protein BS17DRAFT_196627 [Gyrodon lividus]|nr:hypothetical protein BS17DRAFT_196627 [Gyrodon lividus]